MESLTASLANERQAQIHIRWMIRRDMPDVLAIEEKSFEFTWSEQDFLTCLRQRNAIGMVAEHGPTLVGYMVYELHLHSLKILNFAVDPQWRRLGVGRQMAAKLVGKLSSHRRVRITARVRETNTPAHLFFYEQGFRANRVLRNHYLDSSEDAYQFVYRLGMEATQ